MLACWLLIWGRRADVRKVYEMSDCDKNEVSATDAATEI